MPGPLDYSTTAASNTTVGGVSIAEGMQAGLMNDALRAAMADTRKWQLDWSGIVTAGAGNAYTITTNQGVTAYADGMRFSFRADRKNTGAATLNVDSRGAKALRKTENGALVALAADEIVAEAIYDVVYDLSSDVFVIVGLIGQTASGVLGQIQDYGLAVTGSTELVANIDSTTIASGVYRFDGTTTGTFPIDVAAADAGIFEQQRLSSNSGVQFIYHGTSVRVMYRRIVSGVLGAWREIITVNEGSTEGDIIYRGASAWTRLAKGTAFQSVKMNSSATAPEWVGVAQGGLTSTASGGPYNANIPAGVRRIEILFDQISLDSSGNWFVQIGPAAGVATTGYESGSSSRIADQPGTAGFVMLANDPAVILSGRMTLTLMDAGTNLWISDHTMFNQGTGAHRSGAGRIALAGTLERFRLTYTAGNNPDGGQFRIQYE